jgi:UDP-N-acetylmuramate--alanine ligase
MFVDCIQAGGLLISCADDPGAVRIADYARGKGIRVRSYGVAEHADVLVTDIDERANGVEFTVHFQRSSRVQTRVQSSQRRRLLLGSLLGRHMALNGAAAFTVTHELNLDLDRVDQTWREFKGVHRRFEFRGESSGVRVYDDYAHHPTEVAAALSATRAVVPLGGRLVAVFQPGTYSRTQTFAVEFGRAMGVADVAVVMDIFAAREEPIPGVSGALIAECIPLPVHSVVYEPSWGATAARVADLVRAGDVVMTMGIGDVHLLCPEILTEIANRNRPS